LVHTIHYESVAFRPGNIRYSKAGKGTRFRILRRTTFINQGY
jgi:hypothetical protein